MHKEFLSYLSLFQIHCRSISSHLTLLRRGVRGQLYLFSFLSQWHMGFAWIIRKFLHYFWVSVNSLGYALVHIGFNHFCFESDPWVFFISGNFSCSIYLKFFFFHMLQFAFPRAIIQNWIQCLFFLLLFSVYNHCDLFVIWLWILDNFSR